jgi:hypothetical protein
MDGGVTYVFVTEGTVADYNATIPEPSTLIIWSLLGSLAIGLGWWRQRKVA